MHDEPEYQQISECLIRCNVALVKTNDKASKCDCNLADDGLCQSDLCLNRLMRYECPSNCVFGNACANRRFQNREYANLECFDTGNKGFGMRALEPIKRGSLIIEYIGEIIDHETFLKRSKEYIRDPAIKHHYIMSLDANTYIDSTKKGNEARFINHSCDPNAKTEKWTVNRGNRIGFFAVRDIQKGEEVCFDYKFQRFGKTAQSCFCGASNCRGIICASCDDQNNTLVIDSQTSDGSAEDSIDAIEMTECKSESTLELAEKATLGEVPKKRKSMMLDARSEKSTLNGYRILKNDVMKVDPVSRNSTASQVSAVFKKSSASRSSTTVRKSATLRPFSSQFGSMNPMASRLPPPSFKLVQGSTASQGSIASFPLQFGSKAQNSSLRFLPPLYWKPALRYMPKSKKRTSFA